MTRLDLRGLKCPLPALKTGKALAAMRPGEALEVLSDDPLASLDIPNLVRERGDALVEETRHGRSVLFLIRRAAA